MVELPVLNKSDDMSLCFDVTDHDSRVCQTEFPYNITIMEQCLLALHCAVKLYSRLKILLKLSNLLVPSHILCLSILRRQ